MSCLPHRLLSPVCHKTKKAQTQAVALAGPPNPHSPFLVQRILPVLTLQPLCESLRSTQPRNNLQMPQGKGPGDYKQTLPGVWMENSYVST